MEKRNPLTLTLDQPFVAGTDDFSPFYNRLHKLNCAIILYCRAGRGTMAIDLKKYEITAKYTAFSPIKRLRAAVVRTNFFISSLLWCTNIAVRNGMSFSMQANSVFLLST